MPYDDQFHHDKAIFALVGYLEIAEWLDNLEEPVEPAYKRNAHVTRWLVDPSSFNGFRIFKGATQSRRFQFAVPFNREFVEHVPILLASGEKWKWGRTTDLGVIGSNTRTARMFIDPSASGGRKQAERFWKYISTFQNWDAATTKSSGC